MRGLQASQAYVSSLPPVGFQPFPRPLLILHPDPRWASWNLGVFVCIRCSGIHRSMGTHISRVKSVDLDSWTDEQLQSMLNWGNARANKYWEAKLAPGHKPNDSKVESFIRTKYELKRWVMDGPVPDPSTLDDDDNIPLSLVKEKKTIERKESIRKASVGQSSQPSAPEPASAPQADLIGGDPVPARASTTSPPAPKVASKGAPAPPKTTNAKDSLLGLDFFGDQPAAPPRPSSTSNTPGVSGSSRPDLKQSILSLYATAPRPQTQPPQQQQAPAQPFGDAPQAAQQPPSAGLVDAFGGLGLGNAPAAPAKPVDPFASLTSTTLTSKSATPNSSFGGLSGGSFFDSKPSKPPAPAAQKQQSSSASGGLAGLESLTSPTNNIPPSQPAQPSSSAMGDLFDLSSPAPAPAPQPATTNPPPSQPPDSIFNLSAPKSPSSPAAAPPLAPTTSPPVTSNTLTNNDVWGNAWSAPDPPASTAAANPTTASTSNDLGWGSSDLGSGSLANKSIVPGTSGFTTTPQVSADEEFGGWTSSTGGSGAPKPVAGIPGSEDLFSNVWQ